jgi:hypothetical protein
VDDLIFYVAGSDDDQSLEDIVKEESNEEMYAKALGGSEDLVFVKRRSKVSDPDNVQRLFPGTGVRWRDTFCLNVLLQLRYTVTVAVGKMTDDRFSAAEKVVAEAYPSISRPESVVVKGQTLYTYPLLCFTFDNFDELFQRIVVSKGQAIVFQLQVHGGSGAHLDLDKARQMAGLGPAAASAAEGGGAAAAAPAALRATIFEGGVPYDRLHQGYQLRRPSIIDFRNFTDKVRLPACLPESLPACASVSKCIIVECYALMPAAAAAVSVCVYVCVFCVCVCVCVSVCNRHSSRVVTENGVLTDARPWWQGPGGSRRRGETHTATQQHTTPHHNARTHTARSTRCVKCD